MAVSSALRGLLGLGAVSLFLIAFLLVIGRAFAVKNFGRKEMTSSIVVSYYWHFVDVVWIALFIVIYFLK